MLLQLFSDQKILNLIPSGIIGGHDYKFGQIWLSFCYHKNKKTKNDSEVFVQNIFFLFFVEKEKNNRTGLISYNKRFR
jgi:hypothetical protein